VTASPDRGSAADADPESVGQTDAVAHARELIARLARRRAASGLSQTQVARLMRTSQSAVARLESGRHGVELATLIRYAGVLGGSLNFVEDAETPAWDSTENPGPHADARPTGRPGRKPAEGISAMITEMPDGPDPDHVLTWRQRKVLQVMRDFVQERGYPPSMREIGDAVGLASTSSVAFQLATLQRRGYLHRRPRIVEVRLPGDPAGRHEPGLEEDETAGMPGIDIFPLPGALLGEGTLFLLKVIGDSMTGAAITDGDWVVVRQQSSAQDGDLRDGDLVAADIDGVATIRTFKQSDGHFCLSPHNSAYMPTSLDEKVSILGRVLAVLRAA
jgi:repressor LexA